MNELALQLGLTYKWLHVFISFVKIPNQKFEMQATPVTQYQWQTVMGSNPSKFKNVFDAELCPVEQVSYKDCLQFIDKLNKQDKLYNYRLPTEQEWELSCTNEMDNNPKDFGICESNNTQPVCSKFPNKYNLYDMLGNVYEWTSSSYDKSNDNRVIRGGSWFNEARDLRSAFRDYGSPGDRYEYLGFRLVRTLKR